MFRILINLHYRDQAYLLGIHLVVHLFLLHRLKFQVPFHAFRHHNDIRLSVDLGEYTFHFDTFPAILRRLHTLYIHNVLAYIFYYTIGFISSRAMKSGISLRVLSSSFWRGPASLLR